ncbi:LysR family transcriptional regulator [Glycomyces sp. TRM65418]|uniref:LysR family transcriptional regulator n=1 Tax=Glycomyces sp. TRM65418 TaxID=2867006 RepID=UPI001CE63C36|nr:LysR family transcriptional regulator [Glycomyces sp. TRM65418]MCC3765846.1 LysR family transcriptional regulator [Glycomyces sp. TRM65418]QZD55432.1 LysR family transcriptional regulator [Glycomyces sp. TRM65418]
MTDVELRHLATMAAVVEEGSFGRAAVRLGYTQSTVSQQIALLEKAVGGAVFDRPGGPRPVRITPLGQVVLDHGRELLAKARAMATAVERFNAGEGRIDIGTFQSLSNVLLPQLVRRLREAHPGCDIRLVEDESPEPPVGEVDLMFFDRRVGGGVEHRKLFDDPYVLVAPRGAFPDGPVKFAQLDDTPMVAWPPTCDQPRVEQAFASNGAAPRIVFRAAGNEAVLSMVRAGIGSAVLPRLVVDSAAALTDEALTVHELVPEVAPREIFLLWQAGRTQSPLTERAIAIAVDLAAVYRS